MLTVMAGPDMRDATALPYEARDFRIGLDDGVRGLRIAYSATLGYADVDDDVAAPFARAVQVFADLGAIVEAVDPSFENPRQAFEAYYYVRFAWLYDMLTPDQRQLLDPGILEMAEDGRRYGSRNLLEVDTARAELQARMSMFHNTYDLLLTPVVPLAPSMPELNIHPAVVTRGGWIGARHLPIQFHRPTRRQRTLRFYVERDAGSASDRWTELPRRLGAPSKPRVRDIVSVHHAWLDIDMALYWVPYIPPPGSIVGRYRYLDGPCSGIIASSTGRDPLSPLSCELSVALR